MTGLWPAVELTVTTASTTNASSASTQTVVTLPHPVEPVVAVQRTCRQRFSLSAGPIQARCPTPEASGRRGVPTLTSAERMAAGCHLGGAGGLTRSYCTGPDRELVPQLISELVSALDTTSDTDDHALLRARRPSQPGDDPPLQRRRQRPSRRSRRLTSDRSSPGLEHAERLSQFGEHLRVRPRVRRRRAATESSGRAAPGRVRRGPNRRGQPTAGWRHLGVPHREGDRVGPAIRAAVRDPPGDQRATIVEVGGGIREVPRRARHVLDPYPLDEMCTGAHGTPLIRGPIASPTAAIASTAGTTRPPSPNLRSWQRSTASLRWRSWAGIDHDEHRVVMAHDAAPDARLPVHPPRRGRLRARRTDWR